MKYNKFALGFGIAFGVSMLADAFLVFVLALILIFVGAGDFSVMMYVFAAFGILTIIMSCFALKTAWPARIVSTISTLALLGTIIYLVITGIIILNLLILMFFILSLGLGVTATTFAWLSKPAKVGNVETGEKQVQE